MGHNVLYMHMHVYKVYSGVVRHKNKCTAATRLVPRNEAIKHRWQRFLRWLASRNLALTRTLPL